MKRNVPPDVASLAGVIAVLAMAGLALLGSAPSNVLVQDAGKGPSALPAILMPQGWGFFTRDAREASLSVWKKDGEVWKELEATTETDARYAFGANRTARMIGVDLDFISESLEDGNWVECEPGGTPACISKAAEGKSVALAPIDRRLCGSLAIVRSWPVPWSYSPFTRAKQQRVQVVAVKC